MALWRHASAFLVVGSVSGCAVLLGIERGNLDEPSDPPGSDGSVAIPGASGDDGGGRISVPTIAIPAGCEQEKPDTAHGLFVSPSGTNAGSCGAAEQPCATLAVVIQQASRVAGTKTIYVDSGKYTETLTTLPVGVTLQGGWDRLGQSWRRQCVPTRGSSVTIVGSEPTGIRIADLGGEAVLDTMTIIAPTPLAEGMSVYGIFATGATTSLRLVDITVAAGNAGKGESGAVGATGQTGLNCVSGVGGAVGGAGAGGQRGSFAATGYTPTVAQSGTPGGVGVATGQGSAPSCGNCILGCQGSIVGDIVQCLSVQEQRCGGTGTGGCGGGGGGAGGGGRGGGSSIGIFAVGARVTLVRGAVQSGNGGNGGEGGAGGQPGNGTPGTAGQPFTACYKACVGGSMSCLQSGSVSYAGGGAGPTGGKGGNGGAGGGGAGGHSYAVYTLGGASVTLDTTPLVNGNAGAPASNGAPGNAAPRGP